MRTLHRWISIIAAVFLLNVSITGGWLAYDQLHERLYGFGPPPGMGGPKANVPTTLPGDDALKRALLGAYQAAHGLTSQAITAVRVSSGAPAAQARVTVNGDQPQYLVFDAATGTRLVLGPGGRGMGVWTPDAYDGTHTWHQTLKRLHRGDILGFNGRWLDITAGLCLIFLCVSAIWMYLDLRGRRLASGRGDWFWR